MGKDLRNVSSTLLNLCHEERSTKDNKNSNLDKQTWCNQVKCLLHFIVAAASLGQGECCVCQPSTKHGLELSFQTYS